MNLVRFALPPARTALASLTALALTLMLAAPARADEQPAPPTPASIPERSFFAVELDPGIFTGVTSALGEDESTFPNWTLGAGASLGLRLGRITFGAEAEVNGIWFPFAPNGAVGTLGGYAGIQFPIRNTAWFEVRLRGGQHNYFGLRSGFLASDPSPDHTALPFAGVQCRVSIAVVEQKDFELRVYGALGFDVDLSSATLIEPETVGWDGGTMQVGGLSVPFTTGLELAFF